MLKLSRKLSDEEVLIIIKDYKKGYCDYKSGKVTSSIRDFFKNNIRDKYGNYSIDLLKKQGIELNSNLVENLKQIYNHLAEKKYRLKMLKSFFDKIEKEVNKETVVQVKKLELKQKDKEGLILFLKCLIKLKKKHLKGNNMDVFEMVQKSIDTGGYATTTMRDYFHKG